MPPRAARVRVVALRDAFGACGRFAATVFAGVRFVATVFFATAFFATAFFAAGFFATGFFAAVFLAAAFFVAPFFATALRAVLRIAFFAPGLSDPFLTVVAMLPPSDRRGRRRAHLDSIAGIHAK
jgi:hypothetical protein